MLYLEFTAEKSYQDLSVLKILKYFGFIVILGVLAKVLI